MSVKKTYYIVSGDKIVDVTSINVHHGKGTFWAELTDGEHFYSRSRSEIYKDKHDAVAIRDRLSEERKRMSL